ncbi:hypothetical protein DP117_33060 [Brasilonema sp. UFV-L1]|nr:hypothetical protein [Brasilonema sp. UFV-L1]
MSVFVRISAQPQTDLFTYFDDFSNASIRCSKLLREVPETTISPDSPSSLMVTSPPEFRKRAELSSKIWVETPSFWDGFAFCLLPLPPWGY